MRIRVEVSPQTYNHLPDNLSTPSACLLVPDDLHAAVNLAERLLDAAQPLLDSLVPKRTDIPKLLEGLARLLDPALQRL